MTWTLCSIPDARRALAEIRRVLKPSGSSLFVEHGAAPDPGVAAWQNRLTPVWWHIAGGCHLNRDVEGLLRTTGFEITDLQQGYLRGLLRSLSCPKVVLVRLEICAGLLQHYRPCGSCRAGQDLWAVRQRPLARSTIPPSVRQPGRVVLKSDLLTRVVLLPLCITQLTVFDSRRIPSVFPHRNDRPGHRHAPID